MPQRAVDPKRTLWLDRKGTAVRGAAQLRRTKIVCTIGPASSDVAVLEKMMRTGMDVARLNFSHGTHESHSATLLKIRQAARQVGKHVAILQDLCGPKIRVGEMPGGAVVLNEGQEVTFQADVPPAGEILPVEYDDLAKDVKAGDRILFDDGNLEARVLWVKGPHVRVRFVRAGKLKSRKGMNLPGVKISAPSVTEKDLQDLEWGLANEVDYVALSFVRAPEDLAPVRKRLEKIDDPPMLVSKIEQPEAVACLEEILRASDAVMVARGDLGVEMDFAEVPLIQKRLIRMANALDIPVITATQMLESMTACPRPTRAEASDVSNAILDGTDAVMLSGETASGQYPVEAVEAMASIALRTERNMFAPGSDHSFKGREAHVETLHDALALGAEMIARHLDICAIAVATLSGDTAKFVASARPRIPIVGISSNLKGVRRMALYWGVIPYQCKPFRKPGDAMIYGREAILELGLGHLGDKMMLAVGRGPSREFAARLHIHEIGAESDPDKSC